MKRKDIEVMAPVGSYEALAAAVQGGANSIYFGVEQLNMRARSSHNFTLADLEKISGICKAEGLKSYLTLNVVMYDSETALMKSIVDAAKKSGISAIIASDLSVIQYASSLGVEVHLSTQVNITNVESLKFYSQWADVVVLARELNLDQVKHIHRKIVEDNICGPSGSQVKIEMFAHGALCMAVSGKCYLSLHENNNSANRGSCYQTCRKSYIVTEKESGHELEIDNEYIMSPKDLSTIGFVNKLLDAGIRVLKIEGRARSPEYVKTVSSAYSRAVKAVIEGTYNDELITELSSAVASVFNRGFWDGYYLGQRLGEWSSNYGSSATKRKVYLGKISNYFTKIGVAEIKLETGDLKKGDELLIIGPTSGVIEYTVDELRVDTENVPLAKKGTRCSVPVRVFLRRADKVYRWVDASEVKKQ
ncbi:MAG: peptidase U32 family protein [Marinilabiliaceae bacterium]|jgi:putative protease|nr:peptidase U32 family protein [Marinilabiliaceae bacterium]